MIRISLFVTIAAAGDQAQSGDRAVGRAGRDPDTAEGQESGVDSDGYSVAEELARLPNRAADKPFQRRPRRCGRKSNEVRFDATQPLFKALGVDLTVYPKKLG